MRSNKANFYIFLFVHATMLGYNPEFYFISKL